MVESLRAHDIPTSIAVISQNSESNGTPNNVMPLPHALGSSNGKHKNRMIVQLVIESQPELKANR